MTLVYRIIVIAVLVIITAGNCLAGDTGDDRWLANDKLRHFGYSAFLAGGSSIIANRHFDRGRDDSMVIGFSISVSLGAAKETIDYHKPGETSSYKDLVWDIAGAVTGIVLVSFAL